LANATTVEDLIYRKEALSFLKFYFSTDTNNQTSPPRKVQVLALYQNKVHPNLRFKINEAESFFSIVYEFVYRSLQHSPHTSTSPHNKEHGMLVVEEKPPRDTDFLVFADVLRQDMAIPFLYLCAVDELSASAPFAQTHEDWRYTISELNLWEAALQERLCGNQQRAIEDVLTINTLDVIPAVTRTSSPYVPVTVCESNDDVVIYAVIPYYKPNTLKVTVNQLEVILEGYLGHPPSIIVANGSEYQLPDTTSCSLPKCELTEGMFTRVIKLSSPVKDSYVSKRDGMVIVVAKKERIQPTVHVL